jgi:uncharacterized protein YhbP (UPF0306 family)
MGKEELLKYLKTQRLMSIATFSKEPWIASVFYAVDDDFSLYFVSEPDARHCRDIEKNNIVVLAIADSHQTTKDKKKGVQIKGVALILEDEKEIEKAVQLWNKANPGIEEIITFDNIKNGAINSRVYVVKPVLVKFFNEDLYGNEGTEVFEF